MHVHGVRRLVDARQPLSREPLLPIDPPPQGRIMGDTDLWQMMLKLLLLSVWEPMRRMDEPYFRD